MNEPKTIWMRVFYIISNWMIVLSSPLWVLPTLVWLSFEQGVSKNKLLNGQGSLI